MPNDPVTAAARAHLPQDYLAALDRNGLRGAVIGVLRQAYEREIHRPGNRAHFHGGGRRPEARRRDDRGSRDSGRAG